MNQQLYEDIKYGTNIIPEDEYIDTLINISAVASEMVVKTLGPYGRTTMIHDGNVTYPTKDGWSVLRSLRWSDATFNTLYSVLKQVSFDLVSKVGDGTTSAFVGANIFIHKIYDFLQKVPSRQADFLESLKNVCDVICERIENSKYVKRIDPDGDFEDIREIAWVASNGNDELADLIQYIYKETKNPNIYVSLDPGEAITSQILNGYKFECKVINQKIYRNNEDGTYIEANPMLSFVFDHSVGYQEHGAIVQGISRLASEKKCPVAIFAPHFDDVLLNILSTSMQSLVQQGQIPNIILIQVPLSNDAQRTYLSDVTLLTNCQVVDYGKVRAFNTLVHNLEDPENKIEDALLDSDQYKDKSPQDIIEMCQGKIMRLVASDKYVLIQEYEKVVNQKLYQSTMEDVKNTYEELRKKANKSTTTLHKDYLDAYQHYSKLKGNLGTLKIGGTSELEKHFMKDAVDDAVLACKSAYENGYIRGLNLSTLNVIRDTRIELMESESTLDLDIADVIYDVFEELSVMVLNNKTGGDADITTLVECPNGAVKKLSNKEIIEYAVAHEYGYDVVTDKFLDDDKCYVVNSVKTDIEVLKGMISIVSTVLTSNQFLSINRSYDRAMGQKQREDMTKKIKAEQAAAITDSIVDTLHNKWGMNIEGMSIPIIQAMPKSDSALNDGNPIPV